MRAPASRARRGRQRGADGHRDQPCETHLAHDLPANVMPPPAPAADSDDRGCHDLRRRRRRAEQRRPEDHGRRAGLAAQPVDGLHAVDAPADGAHDAPAAGRGAERQRDSAAEHRPQRRRRRRDVAVGEQQRGDHAGRLLGVVGAVAEGERRGGRPLAGLREVAPAAGRAARAAAHEAHERERRQRAEQRRDRERRAGADHADRVDAVQPAPVHRAAAARHERRADEAADERVAGARRQAPVPRDEVPRDGGEQARADDGDRLGAVDRDDSADRARDRRADEQRADEIEHGGEHERLAAAARRASRRASRSRWRRRAGRS